MVANKLKDENIQSEIQNIMNNPYRYRRISATLLKGFCNGRYRKEKSNESRRLSKAVRACM